jgi:hypothetical protein
MKTSVRWLLFEYQSRELVILSKGFKTKELAEKARLKYPDRVRKKIGIGVVSHANTVMCSVELQAVVYCILHSISISWLHG